MRKRFQQCIIIPSRDPAEPSPARCVFKPIVAPHGRDSVEDAPRVIFRFNRFQRRVVNAVKNAFKIRLLEIGFVDVRPTVRGQVRQQREERVGGLVGKQDIG